MFGGGFSLGLVVWVSAVTGFAVKEESPKRCRRGGRRRGL